MTKAQFPAGFRWGASAFAEDPLPAAGTGLDLYRLPVLWSRVFPEGNGASDPRGIAFYDRLIDTLVERDLSPCLTIPGDPLPEALVQQGGWNNRQTAAWFADYVEALYGAFGDRVKTWYVGLDGNRPRQAHHRLLAYAGAVEAYRGSRRGDGRIGPLVHVASFLPATDSDRDITSAHLAEEAYNRLWLDPLMHGAYPVDLMAYVGERRAGPSVEGGDLERISSTRPEHLGVLYTGRHVVRQGEGEDEAGLGFVSTEEPDPQGLYDLLLLLKAETGALALSVTQQRVPDDSFELLRRALDAGVPLESWFGPWPIDASRYGQFLTT